VHATSPTSGSTVPDEASDLGPQADATLSGAAGLEHIRFSGWPSVGRGERHATPRPNPPTGSLSGDHEPLHELPGYVLAQAGLVPERYRVGPLNRRVQACVRALGVCTSEQALSRLHERPELLSTALDALLVGVGEFFRDADALSSLAPHLAALASSRGGSLAIWSAACGQGAELYSLGVLLAELGLLSGSTLLGTDCRSSAVATAKRGVYPASALETMPSPLRARYLVAEGDGWRVVLPEAANISWRVQNVLKTPADGPWDVISCRNVAIYLTRDAACALWAALAERLRPEGLLVVGKAERPAVACLSQVAQCVYSRLGPSHA
jgi:chemotaxis protein methyltransferase CheR